MAIDCVEARKQVVEAFMLTNKYPHARDTPFTPVKSIPLRGPALTAIAMQRIWRLGTYHISSLRCSKPVSWGCKGEPISGCGFQGRCYHDSTIRIHEKYRWKNLHQIYPTVWIQSNREIWFILENTRGIILRDYERSGPGIPRQQRNLKLSTNNHPHHQTTPTNPSPLQSAIPS